MAQYSYREDTELGNQLPTPLPPFSPPSSPPTLPPSASRSCLILPSIIALLILGFFAIMIYLSLNPKMSNSPIMTVCLCVIAAGLIVGVGIYASNVLECTLSCPISFKRRTPIVLGIGGGVENRLAAEKAAKKKVLRLRLCRPGRQHPMVEEPHFPIYTRTSCM
ncbi:hypothetical protein BGX38DRAFT_1215354 [Terfezia claveryi]|nr:hypothetical protein BGX38DRAFT_1215354 [Terfezia claveryi]